MRKKRVDTAARLLREFEAYVVASHSLRKVFVSIKVRAGETSPKTSPTTCAPVRNGVLTEMALRGDRGFTIRRRCRARR